MRVSWLAPHTPAYLALFVVVELFGPAAGGRILLALLSLILVAAIHALAARDHRPLEGAALASILAFSQSLYWGFMPFLFGLPIFLWLIRKVATAPDPECRRADALAVAGLALLTLGCHSLLFAVACLMTVTLALLRRDPLPSIFGRALALVPAGLAGLAWIAAQDEYLGTGQLGPDAVYRFSWLERLSPRGLAADVFGGPRGWLEPAAMIAILAYLLASLLSHRRDFLRASSMALLQAALFLVAFSLLAPYRWLNTIGFGGRFAALGFALLLIAVPAPRLPAILVRGVVIAILVFFPIATASAWIDFDQGEVSGLAGSIAALPEPGRIVGLNFDGPSSSFASMPGLHLAAYLQAQHGGKISGSFAQHYSSFVAYRAPPPIPWTPGLEWHPERFRQSDLTFFDYALVTGDEAMHQSFLGFSKATPLTAEGRVRLYRLR